MGDTWVTDMNHYLDTDGMIAENMSTGALNLALHQGAIVAWMTSRRPQDIERTNVNCRRSPGRRRCPGEIIAAFDDETGGIVWRCPLCDDNGFIHGWEGTPWDRTGEIRANP